jgi:carboxyl-terminal processing protease
MATRKQLITYFVAALAGVLLSSCAVVDPNRVLSRSASQPTPFPTTPFPMPDTDWRERALDFVWTTVNERYYDPNLNGVDWKAVRTRYEPLLKAAKSDDEYWELLDKMTGELSDSHTRIHPPKLVAQQRSNESHSLGLGFAELGTGSGAALTVTTVHPQSDAFWAGVRPGMTIRMIDGEPALEKYRALLSTVRKSSTEWARTRGAVRKITAGDLDSSITMQFVRQDGSTIDATMKRRKFVPPFDFTHRVLPSGFGYVRFSGFNGSFEEAIKAEIRRMKDTPGMIIDLRNNGGGSGGMAADLIAEFLKDDFKGGRVLTRTGKPITVFFYPVIKTEAAIKGRGAAAYTKPVVVLTNEFSASASEMFTMALKEANRVTVVGERTCGCLLGYMGLADVPGGAQMAYSEIGYLNRDGSRVEGNGIAPDLAVPPSRDDLLLNRDRVLERAVAYLQAATSAIPPAANK